MLAKKSTYSVFVCHCGVLCVRHSQLTEAHYDVGDYYISTLAEDGSNICLFWGDGTPLDKAVPFLGFEIGY